MELRQLRHFLMVAETGSIGDAARRLKIAQPTLSKSIQALERSIGAQLFYRSRAGMALTSFGQSLELHARLIATEVGRAEAEVGELLGARRGRVAVGAGPVIALSILPKAIARFLESSPRVEVVAVEGFSDTLLPALKGGLIDYALLEVSSLSIAEELTSEVLLPNERTMVVTAAGNPIASQRNVALREIWRGPWVLPRRLDQFRMRLNEMFLGEDLPPPDIAVEYTSVAMAKNLLREGNFLSLFSESIVRDEIRTGALRVLPVPALKWQRNVGAIFRRDVPLTPAALSLLDRIRQVATEFGRDRLKAAPRRTRK